MQRNLIIILIALFCSNVAFAQNKREKNKVIEETAIQNKQEIETVIYKQAIEYGDVGVAINSLYNLLAKHPDNLSYKDSLAHIYFQIGSFGQCLRVCEDINKTRPNDTIILRMMAMSHQSSGHPVEAIAELETVIKLTGNVLDQYQKAAIEYSIKRLEESKISIETVIAKANAEDKITLYADKDKKQEVPLKAAAFNLYGMIVKDFNDTTKARILFTNSLKIYPEFYFANYNLNALNESSNKKPNEPAQVNNNQQANSEVKKLK